MNPQLRLHFDLELEEVMKKMPHRVHELLTEVPMYIEDYPDDRILRSMGLTDRRSLCGLYTGVPLTKRSVMGGPNLSDVIYLYREGILRIATNRQGQIDQQQLRQQIRITILHELGHHHGLDEEDLDELGYA